MDCRQGAEPTHGETKMFAGAAKFNLAAASGVSTVFFCVARTLDGAADLADSKIKAEDCASNRFIRA